MEVEIEKIFIKPERQRKDLGKLDELKWSLGEVGQINPLIVEPREQEVGTYWLLAGERRLTSMKELGWSKAKAELWESLDEKKRVLVELDENLRRKALTWQEMVLAVEKAWKAAGCPLQDDMAEALGMSQYNISTYLKIAANMDNPEVAKAPTLGNARTLVDRINERKMDNALADLDSLLGDDLEEIGHESRAGFKSNEEKNGGEALEAGSQSTGAGAEEQLDMFATPVESSAGSPSSSLVEPASKSAVESPWRIEQGDFLAWASNYKGPKFNFLHLDFPYGIDLDKSGQMQGNEEISYADGEELYKSLVLGLLQNQDSLVEPKAHCVCWHSFRFAEWTKQEFAKAGWTCLMQPFIWHKSDNKGILADTACGMRNVGEYALVFIRGRKKVCRNISNIYSCPTSKKFHISEKPLKMLEYLFSAFVDSTSRVLDPTCGSGTAIMMAWKKGAQAALGIELNEKFAQKAQEDFEAYKLSGGAEGLDGIDLESLL